MRTVPHSNVLQLLLQGGGALGAYQAGVYQALSEERLHPDWVAGISIGAINPALIAGNPAETRVDKLRSFWEAITSAPAWDRSANFRLPVAESIDGRKVTNQRHNHQTCRTMECCGRGGPRHTRYERPPAAAHRDDRRERHAIPVRPRQAGELA